jgi:drug/metabolite transporter superfamily protein YnfA
MDSIIAVIVGFIFVCILFPRLVKNHTQFYTAFGLVLIMIFLSTLATMFHSEGFSRFIAVLNGMLTIAALALIVLSAGGLSLKDLTGEFKSAIEVIRRGESDKEVIVPLTGEMPKPRRQPGAAAGVATEEERVVEPIDVPTGPVGQTGPAPQRPAGDSASIPLE